jgi:nanoRNase/pAp phosphatase (c-di-AMP/oligoRNAs hydrolase)
MIRTANGGGHAKAAGFELDENVSLQFFNLIFKDY